MTPLARLSLFVCLLSWGVASAEETVDFSSQVRPILSDKCFHCHGPDSENQDSEFRADSKENLFADLGGYAAVVPGDLEASEIHARIHSEDASDQMPPPDSNRELSEEQKRILDLWIKQGAPYEEHWSFAPPQRAEAPTAKLKEAIGKLGWGSDLVDAWSRNPIDAFIARRLIEAGLAPSPEADTETLIRRASLTLTGMLPTPKLRQDLAGETGSVGYAEAVERLLDTDAYAERQTVRWLDAARYADTDGYQNDYGRTNWPWRDWVTKAFRDNMPFDRFTIEQIAGDMLPGATDSQKLASAFNRNHRQNSEGGALAEEFAVENVIDRVETTSTVWLGLTMGCSRCHDHKYDPLSQKEFYQFYGYFNNIGEKGIGKGLDANPLMETTSPLVEIEPELQAEVQRCRKDLREAERGLDRRMQSWADQLRLRVDRSDPDLWQIARVTNTAIDGPGELKVTEDKVIEYHGDAGPSAVYLLSLESPLSAISGVRIEALADERFGSPNRLSPSDNGNFLLTGIELVQNGKRATFGEVAASFEQKGNPAKNAINGQSGSGWAISGNTAADKSASLSLALRDTLTTEPNDKLELVLRFEGPHAKHQIGQFRVLLTSDDSPIDPIATLPDEALKIVKKPSSEWNKGDRKKLREYYRQYDQPLALARKADAAAQRRLAKAGASMVKVMVMREREGDPADFYLLDRGQYDAPIKSEPLTRGVPTALLPDGTEQPKDRIDLAEWLVSRDNPLTARVIVNRIWQDHFGVGLVKTAEDFGLQGETPSHPELLDWLAVEFIESGWDVKAMHRLIVTSAAYRQASRTNPELIEKDPENRLLARGPRYRADGFVIRDIALQASGLLNPKLGGPSVKPYQPKGLWAVVAANKGTSYTPSKGDRLYRKSMYSYWKRAVNPPRQTIFDAGGREVCNVRVRRTNTPLQALVLLNDPTFIESARKLSERVIKSPEASDDKKIAAMYELAIAREIDEATLAVLSNSLGYFREHYDQKPDDAKKLLATGDSPRDESLDAVEHAAMTAVAHVILNLDEFITIE